MGIKWSLTLAVVVVLIALLAWDHSLDPKGWVPSLGANLVTMIVTVVVLDALFRRRQKYAAAAMLRSSFIGIANTLASTAQDLIDLPPHPLLSFEHNIEGWKRDLESFQRDLTYCATDFDHESRKEVKALEEAVRLFAGMGWGDFFNEEKGINLLTAKEVWKTWKLIREIQRQLFNDDRGVATILLQIQEGIDQLEAKFRARW